MNELATASPPIAHAAPSRRLRGLAIAAAVSITTYMLLIGIALGWSPPRVNSSGPLVILLSAAIPMCHCNLLALWWARSRLPSYLKTLLAGAGCVAAWLVLVGLIPVDLASPQGAGWGLSLLTQSLLTAMGATLSQAITQPAAGRAPARFSLAFLFAWTAVVAVFLGGGRWMGSYAGWTAASVLGWEYIVHLQLLAACMAGQFLGLDAALRWPARRVARLLVCALLVALWPFMVAWMMHAAFSNAGASRMEIAVLLGAHGLYTVAALLPWAVYGPRPPQHRTPPALSMAIT